MAQPWQVVPRRGACPSRTPAPMHPALRGLDQPTKTGIVHRDIKAANLDDPQRESGQSDRLCIARVRGASAIHAPA